MRKLFISILIAALLISCSNENSKQANSDSVKTDSVAGVAILSDWQSLTESWTASLNLKNASIMKSFYADSVLYYGDKLSGDDVVKRQQEFFAANADYHQRIVEYISEEQQPDGNWRIRITKQVTANGKKAEYPASLIYSDKSGIWKIISESDDITDLRKGTPLSVHYEPEIITIEGLIEERVAANKNSYFTLWPSQPLDVIATAAQEKEGNTTEINVEQLQLNGYERELRSLLNKKVKISGALFHSHTSYHFTDVLMNVTSVTALN